MSRMSVGTCLVHALVRSTYCYIGLPACRYRSHIRRPMSHSSVDTCLIHPSVLPTYFFVGLPACRYRPRVQQYIGTCLTSLAVRPTCLGVYRRVATRHTSVGTCLTPPVGTSNPYLARELESYVCASRAAWSGFGKASKTPSVESNQTSDEATPSMAVRCTGTGGACGGGGGAVADADRRAMAVAAGDDEAHLAQVQTGLSLVLNLLRWRLSL